MEDKKLNDWFCGLTIRQKEHIATKVLISAGQDAKKALYPNCTSIWLGISTDRKIMIHDHCTDRHGMWVDEGSTDNTLGHDF